MKLNKTIQEIELLLAKINQMNHPEVKLLMMDERKGVQQVLKRWMKKIEIEQKSRAKFVEMTEFENKYWQMGYGRIAGVDEVGRGPLAGPVVSAAVILPKNFDLIGIDDSKKLSEKKRNEYYHVIQECAISIGIGIVEPEIIDKINIYQATKKAMSIALHSLSIQPEVLLIDAMELETPYVTESIIKGDAKSISIAAASIIAKVTRDKMMEDYSIKYPEYQFESNMGYGTSVHLEAIVRYGITPIHRKSFAPIKDSI
jgi:ribonuclease HII